MRPVVILCACVTFASVARAAPGDPCTPGVFTCTDVDGDAVQETLVGCDDTSAPPAEIDVDCGTLVAGATCAEPGCIGAGCATVDTTTCEAAAGGLCQGFAAVLDADPSNDFFLGCPGDDSCWAIPNADGTALEDRCAAHVGPACAAVAASSCTDSVWTQCVPIDVDGTGTRLSNVAVDCAIFRTTCGPQPCACDAQCNFSPTGTAKCTGGVCDFGITCVVPAPQLAACSSEGEGEGEGEGNTPTGCASDFECAVGETCNAGTCGPSVASSACSGSGGGAGGGAWPLAALALALLLLGSSRRSGLCTRAPGA